MANKRLGMLLAGLAACAALVARDHWPSKPLSVSEAVAPRAKAAPRAPQSPAPHRDADAIPALRSREAFAPGGGDLFQGLAPARAVVAAPAVQPAGPPPPPSAPALPFTLIGRKLEQGKWEIYLAKGDKTYIARLDDVIDDTYKVVSIRPPSMTLLYLPLNENQDLPIGGAPHDGD